MKPRLMRFEEQTGGRTACVCRLNIPFSGVYLAVLVQSELGPAVPWQLPDTL